MIRKPLELPPEVARSFVNAMRDYFAETDVHKRDAIAAHQLKVLQQCQGARGKPLRLSDVREMFGAMKDIFAWSSAVQKGFLCYFCAYRTRAVAEKAPLLPSSLLTISAPPPDLT